LREYNRETDAMISVTVIMVPGETVSVTYTRLPRRRIVDEWGPIVDWRRSKYVDPERSRSVRLIPNIH
jgi:hypothetical protein